VGSFCPGRASRGRRTNDQKPCCPSFRYSGAGARSGVARTAGIRPMKRPPRSNTDQSASEVGVSIETSRVGPSSAIIPLTCTRSLG
jgi:hypothetical protein